MAATLPTFLCLCLNLLSAPEFLSGYDERETATGTLYWRGWSATKVDELARRLPVFVREVEEALEREIGHPFVTVIAPDGYELRRIVTRLGSDPPSARFVLGVALPRLRMLVLREGLVPGTHSSTVTLRHEIAHLVIHRDLQARIPRWFDEGVATWIGGGGISADAEAFLSFLARIDALYPLEKLEYRFPPHHDMTSIAYRQSYLLVLYLIERSGEDVVPRLLDLFESGAGGREALETVTGGPLEDLEEQFAAWVASRHGLLRALATMVNVWTIAAFLAVVAIARHLIRRRRRLRELDSPEDEDEAVEPLAEEP